MTVHIFSRCKIESNCWIWQGATSGFGYPVANINGRGTFTYLHKHIYSRYKGDIIRGMKVDHICNNPKCLKPGHLQVLTHGDNVTKDGNAGQHHVSIVGQIFRPWTAIRRSQNSAYGQAKYLCKHINGLEKVLFIHNLKSRWRK